MKKIEVVCRAWGGDWVLGVLADDGAHLLFEYSAEALRRGIEFSPRGLKLRPEAYGDFPNHQHRLPGLIADALPDGWGMLLMDRLITQNGIKREQISPLDRLRMMGDRTMGAFSFRPPAADPSKPVEMSLLMLPQHKSLEVMIHI